MEVAEEEKDESSEWVDVQEELLSKCALFVCNKWDQLNENLGTKSVTDEILKKLKRACPGVDPDSQIIYMSTKHDLIAQDLGVISKNFSALLDKMRSLVLRSIQAKHEFHWRLGPLHMFFFSLDVSELTGYRQRKSVTGNFL